MATNPDSYVIPPITPSTEHNRKSDNIISAARSEIVWPTMFPGFVATIINAKMSDRMQRMLKDMELILKSNDER